MGKKPNASLTSPLKKRKPSKETVKLMAKYYRDSANDDLALAKECEGMDSDIDINCVYNVKRIRF